MTEASRRLLLVDGYSLVHRAFFALPPLQTADGQPTHAVHGFLNMLLKLLDEERPTHVAVAVDAPGPTFRDQRFESYKAHRPETPDALRSQFPLVREALAALGVAVVEQPGYEADDVIGTLARRGREDGFDVVIVSGDRDLLQLLEPGVRVRLTRKGISELHDYDPESFQREYGIPPARLVDVKALMGDTSDNIPGVPGIGEKTALALVREHGGVEAVLAAADGIANRRVREALHQYADQARLSRELAQIVRDVPLASSWDDLRRREADAEHARRLFTRLEMRSLLRRLGLAPAGVPEAGPGAVPAEGGPAPRRLDDPAALREALAAAREGHAERWVGVAHRPGGWVAIADGSGRAWFAEQPSGDLLAALCEGGNPRLAIHDAKPLLRRWLRAGGDVAGWVAGKPPLDTAVAAFLVDASRSNPRVSDLARAFGLPDAPDPEETAGKGQPDPRQVAALAARQAAAVSALAGVLRSEIQARGLTRLLEEIELPLIPVLAAMEHAGVRVEPAVLDELGERFRRRLDELAGRIYELAGVRFNINSTQQLGEVLFERLKLPPVKRTKTGFSTDAEVLEELAAVHPVPELVLEHRQLAKLLSTYVEGLRSGIEPDGRVRTTFQQTVAATGRLASTDPNLQNIPVRDEPGRQLRRAFVAEPGWRLVAADYSQIELRVLAHVSGDPGLIEAFRRGEDIHRRTAAEVFGVGPDEVTPAQRSAAKAVVFGISYGISDFGLARQLRIDREQARRYIERFFERYPGVRRYMQEAIREARQTGAVRTLFGRIRPLPDIHNRVPHRRQAAERAAVNTPIQGTAADIIKIAMIRLFRRLRDEGSRARLILQVHDELIAEAPADEAAAVARIMAEEMEGAADLAVPLVVDVRAGPNWYEMEDVRLHDA